MEASGGWALVVFLGGRIPQIEGSSSSPVRGRRPRLAVRQLLIMIVRSYSTAQSTEKMVNAIKGLFISCDVPMAQFIVNLNASMPASEKFILQTFDPTHMFVQPHVAEMIRSKIAEFRDQNSYEKPA
uniref:General transcription and DNA repair factor IIH subunit TFB5 n=1 Tax=Oryza brachyantha TaxID=4533 RepID=J3M391_ORYBR